MAYVAASADSLWSAETPDGRAPVGLPLLARLLPKVPIGPNTLLRRSLAPRLEVSTAYGAARPGSASADRVAALIGADGRVIKYFPRVDHESFPAEVLRMVTQQ